NNPIEPCGTTYTWGSAVDFTLVVGEEPECMPVTDLTVEAISMNEIIVTWEGPDNAESWEVEYAINNGPQGSGVTETVTTNSLTIDGLEGDTNYAIYVTPVCEGEEGLARMTTVFTGYCTPSTNYSEYLVSFNTEGGLSNIDYAATSQPAGGYENQSEIELVAFAGSEIDFTSVYSNGSNGTNIWIDFDRNLIFDEDENVYYDSGTSATQNGSFDIPSDLEPGSYRMRVRSQWGSSANPPPFVQVSYGSTVDFTLTIVELDCMPATDITYALDNDNNVIMSWTGNDDVAEWEIEYGVRDFTPGDGTTVTTTDTSYLFTDLELDTEYDFYITGDCTDEEGITIGPRRFFFGYCTPSTNFGEYLVSFDTERALTDIGYSATSQPAGGYDNQSDMALVAFAGSEIDFTSVYSTGSNGTNIC